MRRTSKTGGSRERQRALGRLAVAVLRGTGSRLSASEVKALAPIILSLAGAIGRAKLSVRNTPSA